MSFKVRITLVSLFLLLACPAWGQTLPGKWAAAIEATLHLDTPADRIEYLSDLFLGTSYQAGTLGGGPGQPETLIINLAAVDCFTLLDYVEAMRHSESAGEFRQQLIRVRYREAEIDWKNRRHFFSDWVELNGIVDVTASIGGSATRQVSKRLNRQADGQPFLPEVPVRERSIDYIPKTALSRQLLKKLRNGDYLGIYSDRIGLDVSHVGIVVRREGDLLLRHASSSPEPGMVRETPLLPYLEHVPGIVVLRVQAE